MNKYDTGNYNYRIKNTTAVWNLTPPPANIALIPQQHVILLTVMVRPWKAGNYLRNR